MIQNISTTEFVTSVMNGSYNENDVQRYCNTQPSLMPLFKSLHKVASTLIASKGIQGGFVWNLTERRWDFDNAKDLHLYMDAEFTRLQSAMGIVCDHIEEQEHTEPQHGKENAIEQYITGSDKETTIQAIKSLVCGKKGKQAAVIIAVAVSDGYMSKAKFDILKEAFGIIGTKQAFNNAYKMYFEPDNTATEKEPRDRNKAMKLSASYKSQTDAAKATLKRAIEDAG